MLWLIMLNHYASSFKGQKVLVVGGSSGIGLAVAETCALQGAEVVIASSSLARVEAACRVLPTGVRGEVLDVTSVNKIAEAFERIGDIDHLVFTAGDHLVLDPLNTLDLEAARRAFEVRYWGALNTAKIANQYLRRTGSITFSSGIGSQRPMPGWSVTASILGALEALTRSLAVELAPLRVNAVSSGVLRTPLWSNMDGAERESLFAQVAEKLPVGRVGEASDSAKAYIYLMQQAYGTGQVIIADGGHVLV